MRKRQEEIQNSREGKDNIAEFIELKGNFHHKLCIDNESMFIVVL